MLTVSGSGKLTLADARNSFRGGWLGGGGGHIGEEAGGGGGGGEEDGGGGGGGDTDAGTGWLSSNIFRGKPIDMGKRQCPLLAPSVRGPRMV